MDDVNFKLDREEPSIADLRAREVNLAAANFPPSFTKSITTTLLIESDVIRLMKDYYAAAEMGEFEKWEEAILVKAGESLRWSLRELLARTNVETTMTIKFDRS